MAKRIVEEITKGGKVQYRVETNDGLFGLRKRFNKWVTCIYECDDSKFDAVFRSKSEAEKFCIDTDDTIISSQIIKIYE